MGTLYCATPAKAQFAVQPMVLSLKAKPGIEIKTEIRLQNLQQTGNEPFILFSMQISDLLQSPDGQWLPVRPLSNGSKNPVHPSNLSSCRSWTQLGFNLYQTDTTESHDVTINVPEDAQGLYCAALLVTIENPFESTGIITDYEFTVPIMVEVEGPGLDHAICTSYGCAA